MAGATEGLVDRGRGNSERIDAPRGVPSSSSLASDPTRSSHPYAQDIFEDVGVTSEVQAVHSHSEGHQGIDLGSPGEYTAIVNGAQDIQHRHSLSFQQSPRNAFPFPEPSTN